MSRVSDCIPPAKVEVPEPSTVIMFPTLKFVEVASVTVALPVIVRPPVIVEDALAMKPLFKRTVIVVVGARNPAESITQFLSPLSRQLPCAS